MLRWLLVLLHRFSILRSLRGCRTSALLALLFIFLGVGNASAAVYGFRHVGVDAGLSNREVNSICVDAHGLVWICTPWGLDKYDGNNVTSFSTQADGLGSLALYNVQEFGNDTLVVRSEDGYLIFRRSTESFSRADDFLTSVGASVRLDGLWIDDGKNVWVYDKGRFFVTTQHGQTYDVPVATDYSRIATLAVVHGGVIVLFESGRLLRCVAPTDGCSPSPISMSSPLAGGANAMYVDSHNDFWAVNATGDTLWHRPQSGKKWTISLTSLDLDKSKHIVMNGIAEDVQGAIWISTVSDGLYVANRKAGALTHVGRDVSSPNGLRSNFCTCLTASRGVNQAVYVGYANAGFSTEDAGSGYLKHYKSTMGLAYNPQVAGYSMSIYCGPNKYAVLSDVEGPNGEELSMERLIPLGGWLIGWFNRWIVIPVFDFLSKYIANFGIIILILTLLVKALIVPLTYKSYLSTAKMRVIKPEMDALNAKYPRQEDAMKKQQATMELYNKAGISPMSGCLPMLIQMPILIAMFRFFPASIELRGKSFLWSDDLSSYDSILDLPFNIPFYGDHISLFCLLMTIVMFAYSYMNYKQTATSQPQMPGMKFMTVYMMPIMLLFWFNSYSSGLCYYYLLSNIITMLMMFGIRALVDDEKVRASINSKMANTKGKKSRFQQRYEELLRQQEQMQKQQKR